VLVPGLLLFLDVSFSPFFPSLFDGSFYIIARRTTTTIPDIYFKKIKAITTTITSSFPITVQIAWLYTSHKILILLFLSINMHD
jgi:hypothetical protein